MTTVHTGSIRIRGADLHYRWTGEGPWLLILHGGAADADGAGTLVEQLSSHYRVLTHDRRGLSRSRVDAGGGVSRLEEHADDVHQLLSTLGAERVYVFGISLGAIIGLDLITRYPEHVRFLVAQEPPLAYLLPTEQCAEAVSMQEELETTLLRDGVEAALRKFMQALAADTEDVEEGFEPPKLSRFVLCNYAHFLRYDAPCVRRFRLDIEALARRSSDIVLAIGARTHESLVRGQADAPLKVGPAVALADRLGLGLRVFPGGHGGYASHPRAFRERLRNLLDEHMRQSGIA